MTRILTLAFGAAMTASVVATAALAQTPAPPAPTAQKSCEADAAGKKLVGAALKSFMTKCEKDAGATCTKEADGKKLAGAARTSFTKKCVTDAVGKKA